MIKKVLTTIILILCCTYLQAQPPTVAGVQFGTSYEQAKTILDRRFNGGENSYQLQRNKLTYYNVKFARETFDYAEFFFETNGKRTFLSRANFLKSFNNDKFLAGEMRERLVELYEKKYEYRQFLMGDGCFADILGSNYFNPEEGFVVIEKFEDSTKSNKKKKKEWVTISYHCEGFVNVKDEI